MKLTSLLRQIQVGTTFANKPYDEAYDISQDLSMVESYDGRGEKVEKVPTLST